MAASCPPQSFLSLWQVVALPNKTCRGGVGAKFQWQHWRVVILYTYFELVHPSPKLELHRSLTTAFDENIFQNFSIFTQFKWIPILHDSVKLHIRKLPQVYKFKSQYGSRSEPYLNRQWPKIHDMIMTGGRSSGELGGGRIHRDRPAGTQRRSCDR